MTRQSTLAVATASAGVSGIGFVALGSTFPDGSVWHTIFTYGAPLLGYVAGHIVGNGWDEAAEVRREKKKRAAIALAKATRDDPTLSAETRDKAAVALERHLSSEVTRAFHRLDESNGPREVADLTALQERADDPRGA